MKVVKRLLAGAMVATSVSTAVMYIQDKTDKLEPVVSAEEFAEDNRPHYSGLETKEVPSFETKDNDVQQLVLVVDFHTYYKGGSIHLVTCDEKVCDTPSSRTLQLLDDRNDEEAMYYKRFFDE